MQNGLSLPMYTLVADEDAGESTVLVGGEERGKYSDIQSCIESGLSRPLLLRFYALLTENSPTFDISTRPSFDT